MRIDIALAIAPRAPLLDDPRRQAGGRIGEPEREGLRFGPHDLDIAGLFGQPVRELRPVTRLVFGRLGQFGQDPRQRHQRDVDAPRLVGVGVAEMGRNIGAEILAVGEEPVMAQHVGHQHRKDVGGVPEAEAALARREGKPVAGQGRRHDGEGIFRAAAELRRPGQARDQPVVLVEGPGPAVGEQQRRRIRRLARHMGIVQVVARDGDLAVVQAVERRFLGAPVIVPGPVGAQRFEIGDVGAELPGVAGRPVGPAGGAQPAAQVVERLVLDGDLEGARRPPVPDERAVALR